MDPRFIAQHRFSPLLHYTKVEKRYKKDPVTAHRAMTSKPRPIKYASHRDACILAYYAHLLNEALDVRYAADSTGENAIAYRALGRSNGDFAAEAFRFAQSNAPVTILAFDVTSFFDTLDHGLLKARLKLVLGVSELPDDWYKVFRHITAFHYVELDELKQHPVFGPRIAERSRDRIASVEELKAAGVTFHANPELAKGFKRGIPQGTPISAAASNAYMVEFDAAARAYCDGIGALYRRYSDDILVICKPEDAAAAEARIMDLIDRERLEINPAKTEKTLFGPSAAAAPGSRAAQYLGFTFAEDGAAIRERSMSNQWRKLRRAMRRARKSLAYRIRQGLPAEVHTKGLNRRFAFVTVHDGVSTRALRNFPSYARRSAAAFDEGGRIRRQVKRLERTARSEIAALKRLGRSSGNSP